MATVYKYRYYCDTESAYVYHWSEDEPTVCKNDAGSISQIKIIGKREDNLVQVKEESVDTGGHFRAYCPLICPVGPTGTIYTEDFVFKNDTGILSMDIIPKGCEGDYLDLCIAPDTVVGALSQSSPSGSTLLNVSETVSENVKIGYHVKLSDGVNVNDCGEVLEVDKINHTLLVDIATTVDFDYTTPTYVLQTIYMAKDFYLPPDGRYPVGDDKIGASFLPKNTVVQMQYHKNDAEDKKLWVIANRLY